MTYTSRFFSALCGVTLFMRLALPVSAQTNDQIEQKPLRKVVTNLYFHTFNSEFTLLPNSNLVADEKMQVDVGTIVGKHGIFYVLPEQYSNTQQNTVSAPVTLRSITDFAQHPIPYKESRSFADHTVSWQVGDANTSISGVNEYEFQYQVENVIQTENAQFDEWRWNILGSFWNFEIDNYSAIINLPTAISAQNTHITIYRGKLGSRNTNAIQTQWLSPHQILIQATKPMDRNEGITLSLEMPKGIFQPYVGGWWYQYGTIIIWSWPILIFLLAFTLWFRYGKDAATNQAIVPEYAAPEGMGAMDMKLLLNRGRWHNEIISIGIMNLAVKEFIKIEVKPLAFWRKDITIIETMDDTKRAKITVGEMNLLQDLLSCRLLNSPDNGVSLSDLKLSFPKKVTDIKERLLNNLHYNQYISKYALDFYSDFWIVGGLMLIAATVIYFMGLWQAALSLTISALILMFFAPFMYQLTPKGAVTVQKIKGFKMFMTQVETYRQQFFEREGDLVELLPYAMAFGITTMWLHKLKDLVSEERWSRFQVNVAGSLGSISNVSAAINSISSSISSSMSSGSGGVGSGGGGGGGGSW